MIENLDQLLVFVFLVDGRLIPMEFRSINFFLILIISLVVSSCGGGGGGSAAPAITPPAITENGTFDTSKWNESLWQ